MQDHAVLTLIKQADIAIGAEDFDALIGFYAEDAVLVVQPGQMARGKAQIKKAFAAIAKYFKNTLNVTQGQAHVIEGADTALVIMETVLHIAGADAPITRRATYVFKRDEAQRWLCTVDNSYGTDLLNDAA
ncbi:MAG: SgcJ/EcaC family oxidoreductase [Pseudomonadota bacterium]